MPHSLFSFQRAAFVVFALALLSFAVSNTVRAGPLAANFAAPPPSACPWVYWYIMDGNLTHAGTHADLEAMKKAGIGGAIFLNVNLDIPRSPVVYMRSEWQDLSACAVSEAKRLGLAIALGPGPGWCGTGGPWVTPELSTQHLVASTTTASGPAHFDVVLPRPLPRIPAPAEFPAVPADQCISADKIIDLSGKLGQMAG